MTRAAFDLRALGAKADALLEECARSRLSLEPTLERFLPEACRLLGAEAAQLRTKTETLEERTFRFGRGPFPVLRPRRSFRRSAGRRWVQQALDVAGAQVGAAAFAFPRGREESDLELGRAVEAVCEELDVILWNIATQAFKQQLIENMGRSLTRRMFDHAIDDAVAEFRKAVRFRRFALIHVDDEEQESGRLHYRVYEGGRCTHHSRGRPHSALERALSRGRAALRGEGLLERALQVPGAVRWPLVAGVARPRPIGAALVDAPRGLDLFGRDLLHVFANAVTQRLVDYNRERRHLGQFFSPQMIDALMREPDYARRLEPRVARIVVLYADINSFTKLCEKALKAPDRIGDFVDEWSEHAVRVCWKHGGVFDKMVGDCVIAHFGPPFFRRALEREAVSAVTAALEIQRFTAALGRRPQYRRLAALAGLPGLGVGVGVNLCTAAVGLFGPNKELTAFSRGMNETARLQAQAGFRETVVMDSVRQAVQGRLPGVSFSGPHSAAVKNVAKPLRFYKVLS